MKAGESAALRNVEAAARAYLDARAEWATKDPEGGEWADALSVENGAARDLEEAVRDLDKIRGKGRRP